MIIVIILM